MSIMTLQGKLSWRKIQKKGGSGFEGEKEAEIQCIVRTAKTAFGSDKQKDLLPPHKERGGGGRKGDLISMLNIFRMPRTPTRPEILQTERYRQITKQVYETELWELHVA